MFQEIEKVKEQDNTNTVSVLESSNSLVTTTNNVSQSFNPTSFLFGDKSSASIFEKTTPCAPLFGSNPIFGNVPTDFSKTDDTKSTKLFGGLSTTVPSSQSVFGTFSAARPFSTTGSTELQNTIPQTSLFSKTDDVKSKTEGLFNFSPKPDSPFKFGSLSKDPKSVFGQSLLSNKDKSLNEGSLKGII